MHIPNIALTIFISNDFKFDTHGMDANLTMQIFRYLYIIATGQYSLSEYIQF